MATAKDRELIPISTQAHEHLRRIVYALKAQGLRSTMTGFASALILSQPVPDGGDASISAAAGWWDVEKKEEKNG